LRITCYEYRKCRNFDSCCRFYVKIFSMSFYIASLLATSIASFLLAVFVYLKGKDRTMNITLALFSLAFSVWTFAQAFGELLIDKRTILILTRINVGAAVLLPVFYLHFILSLLKLDLNQKNILRTAYFFSLVFVFLVFTPLFVKDIAPAAGFKYYPAPGMVYPFFALYLLSCFIYGFARLVLALRRTSGEDHQRLLYVFVASLIGFSGGITAFFPVFNINFPVLSHLSLPVYVAITVYAIVKHKLLDISIIVREGLVYSALTVLFAVFYVLVVLIANYSLSRFIHLDPVMTALAVVFISVMVFQPVRDRVQGTVDRLFFMGEYRYQKTINDLSKENRRLFRSLLQADKLAALGTLSAGMAHEIKNPLAALAAMTQMLPENSSDDEFMKDYREMVPRQLERINRIVENLLRTGEAPSLEKKETDVNSIIGEVLELNSSLSRKKRIDVLAKLGALPAVFADPGQLQLVFSNLVLNAMQAMPHGGRIEIASWESGGRVFVQIADNGVGIPADKLDKIFDPFFSLREGGTGLGLFTAYRIIQEHGGMIEVESQIGKGTKFTICLPIKPEPSA